MCWYIRISLLSLYVIPYIPSHENIRISKVKNSGEIKKARGFRDFRVFSRGVFGIYSGFFRDFQISISISGILGFSGFCIQDFFGIFKLAFSGFHTRDFFGIFKSRSRSPGFRYFRYFQIKPKIENSYPKSLESGSRKNSIPKATLLIYSQNRKSKFFFRHLFRHPDGQIHPVKLHVTDKV